MKINQHSVAIIVALIGLVGVLGAAIITVTFNTSAPNFQSAPTSDTEKQKTDIPVKHPVVIDPGGEYVYSVYSELITPSKSHVELSINGNVISSHPFNQGWDSGVILLQKGSHAFKFKITLKLKDKDYTVKDSCAGLVIIDGPTKLRPWIKFKENGSIDYCELIAW